MLHNITEYKKAKVIVKELEKALAVVNASQTSLQSYSKYRPIKEILTTIEDVKPVLERYLNQFKIIVETKGAKK